MLQRSFRLSRHIAVSAVAKKRKPARQASAPASAGALSSVQSEVVGRIVSIARTERLDAGTKLIGSALAERIGVSRSPVNAALNYLVRRGLASHDANVGFTLSATQAELAALARELSELSGDPLYLQIAHDRREHTLPDSISETELMRRYGATRHEIRRVLARASGEGWIGRRLGHGWTFQPMIDSASAYEESYVFRATIEPMGLLSPWFRPNPEVLADLRKEQEYIVNGGYAEMTPIELFEANRRFHETLAAWSGNRFILQSLERVDSLRRLIEYGMTSDRPARGKHAAQHLKILEAIEAGDAIGAATRMREHLEDARRDKVREVAATLG